MMRVQGSKPPTWQKRHCDVLPGGCGLNTREVTFAPCLHLETLYDFGPHILFVGALGLVLCASTFI